MDEGQRVITSKDELAKLMKRSRRQIDRWIRAGMPVLDDNCFDLAAIQQWLLVRNGVVQPGTDVAHSVSSDGIEVAAGENGEPARNEVDGDSQGGKSEADQDASESYSSGSVSDQDSGSDRFWWDKESKKYQARLRELDYRKRLGELIERVRVEDEFVARVHAVKKAMIAFERALPPELVACRTEREMSEVIRKSVRNVLENFARPLPKEIQSEATGE